MGSMIPGCRCKFPNAREGKELEKERWMYLLRFRDLEGELQASLYYSYRNLVYKDIYFLLRDHHYMEDVLQEAFLKTITNADHIKHHMNLSGWIRRVARNVAIDYMRKQKKHRQFVASSNAYATKATMDSYPSNFNLALKVEKKLQREMLLQAIDELKVEYRVLLNLHYIEERSYKEISKQLQLSEQVITQRLARARRKLAQLVSREWVEDGR